MAEKIGFELTVTYVEEVHPQTFPKVLRNLWLMSFIQLTTMMLLVWAVVPYSDVQSHSGNILSLLAEHAAQAKWLRYWLVADAVLVLCAGTSPCTIESKFRCSDGDNILMWVYRTFIPGPHFTCFLSATQEIHRCSLLVDYHLCGYWPGNVWCRGYQSNHSFRTIRSVLHRCHGSLCALESLTQIQSRSLSPFPTSRTADCRFRIYHCVGCGCREYRHVFGHCRVLCDIFYHCSTGYDVHWSQRWIGYGLVLGL